MQVHDDERIANDIGPEPCVCIREGVGEASVGEHVGQPLSLENDTKLKRRRFAQSGRQHGVRALASVRRLHVVPDPGMRARLFTREPGEIMTGQRGWSAPGRGKTRSR